MSDRILETFLEEVLGGTEPPDLTDRIVAALNERSREGVRERQEAMRSVPPAPRPIVVPSLVPAPVVPVAPASTVRITAARTERRRATWLPLALAASLLVAIGAHWEFTSAARLAPSDHMAQKAKAPEPEHSSPQQSKVAEHKQALEKTAPTKPPEGDEVQPAKPAVSEVARQKMPEGEQPSKSAVAASATRGDEPDAGTAGDAVATSSLENALSTSATSDRDVIAFVNAALKSRWKESGVRPSPPATESEWCRRVYLDLIGRIPTIDELEAFLVDTDSKTGARDKRAKLVDRLLGEGPKGDDRYLETYARYWTTLWTNLLIGRTGGMEPNSPINRQGLQQYLRRSFLANKPYNRLVYELISAQGANRPVDAADNATAYNGAVNFLLAQTQEKATPATAKTAQLFLGMELQCTQCHNHPFNEWKQNRFWELNAFFRQMREERTMEGNQLKAVRLIDSDFAGEGGDPREAEVYFELRNGVMQVAYPTFVDGTAVDPNGLVSVVNRRQELARLVSRSTELKLAIVNRMWSHFLGYGFTKPLDDLGPHNPPSHPDLLARLADEFGNHGYDLKRLMRWIVLSDAYALSSKFGSKLGNSDDDPTMGTPPLFSHFYLRQMSAEQLYESLLVATGAHRTDARYEEQQRLKDRWLEQFAIAFGTDENDEATTFDGTITQTLVLMNGELTRNATSGETGSFLSQLSPKAERALNELYLAALARRPSRGEVQVANNLLMAQSGNTKTALEDIWWALLNSSEFIFNH